MRRRPHLGAVALVAVLACGVAGCGADSPKPGPVAESSASATASSAPPTQTREAKSATEVGARAFVKYFVDSFNYASRSGDTTAFEATFASCPGCEELTKQIKTIYNAGGYAKGGEWRIVSMKRTGDRRYQFNAVVSIEKAEILQSSEAVSAQTFEADPSVRTGFLLVRRGSAWKMQGLEQAA